MNVHRATLAEFLGQVENELLKRRLMIILQTMMGVQALTMGLLPIVVPGLYSKFPSNLQILLGNGLAMGVLTAVLMNILFHHVGSKRSPENAHSEKEPEASDDASRPAVVPTRTAP